MFIVGAVIGSVITYKVINTIANKNSDEYTHLKTGNTYTVLGKVLNATNDRDGQEMVLYGNNNNEFFVRRTIEFETKFKAKK